MTRFKLIFNPPLETTSLGHTHMDVSTGATGPTTVANKFSDTLTLFQPGGQILPTNWRGRT